MSVLIAISSLQRKLRIKPTASAVAPVVNQTEVAVRTSEPDNLRAEFVAPDTMNGTMPLSLNPHRAPSDSLAASTDRTAKATSPRAKPAPLAEKLGGEKRFAFIDALRGLAAVAVALHHIFRYGPLPESALKIVPHFANVFFRNGRMGVPVFFVISGFVIAYVLRNARIDASYLRTFAVQRFLRLGPPYWFTMALVIALYALTRAFFLAEPTLLIDYPTLGGIAAHIFYLENLLHYENISMGFWTLCVEMQFYLLFALMLGLAQWIAARTPSITKPGILHRWTTGSVLMAVFAPLAVLSLFKYSLDSENTDWVSHFFVCFFLGAMIWWTLDRRVARWMFWAFIAAAIYRQHHNWTLHMTVALTTTLAIYTVGRLGHLGDWLNFRWLQYLGTISYSLYLIHYPISWIVGSIGFGLTGDAAVPALIWLVLGLAVSIGAAHILHVTIEIPAIRLARRYKESRSGGIRPLTAAGPVIATAAGR